VHHELDTLIKKTRVSYPSSSEPSEEFETLKTIKLLDEHVVAPSQGITDDLFAADKVAAAGGASNVIPLKRR
jgi:hypothetical protein